MGTRQPKVVGYLTEMVACKLKKKKKKMERPGELGKTRTISN